MAGLEGKECVPCQGGTPPLAEDQISNLLSEIDEGWSAIDNHHISREWEFPDFETALAFTNKLGAICEEQNHHADFELGWGRVQAVIFTHKIDGLTESDFILASKFDQS
jgi:4a-hydroxytetrahydrobiopterin dehydratase|tara:strand:+ start:6950 stop:7276 length:327 start_codon:yes stop_codon:yes gene_type:complete